MQCLLCGTEQNVILAMIRCPSKYVIPLLFHRDIPLFSNVQQQVKFDHQLAVLACAFGEDTRAFSGGLDNGVHKCILLS